MDKFTLVYLADRDYIAARLLNFCGNTLYSQAAYHSQQCVEKYLKALLLQKGEIFPKEHKLNRLRSLCEKYYQILTKKEVIELVIKFDFPEQVARYGPFATFDPLSKKVKGKFETKGVFICQDIYIKDLDELVFQLRSEIDFSHNNNADNLLAILAGNKTNILVNGWKLKFFSIRDVLVSSNDYYK